MTHVKYVYLKVKRNLLPQNAVIIFVIHVLEIYY